MQTSSEISLHLLCENHPEEEYIYYSTPNKWLLCAQCLLENTKNGKECEVKSIKKCVPLILQNFEDFLNSVEVNWN